MRGPVDVAPLTCARCGAPVPVGVDDVDVVDCRACQTSNEGPVEVARLRKAARTETEARERARRLAAELNAPPTTFRRFWKAASVIAGLAIMVIVVVWFFVAVVMCGAMVWKGKLSEAVVAFIIGLVLAVPLVFNQILHDLAPWLGIDLADVLSDGGAYAALALGFFFSLTLPMILGDYASGFDRARELIRGILAARPPHIEGGPSECRLCGAALEVTAASTHARCIYCSTDNLVDVPKVLSDAAAEDARSKYRDVAAAHAEVEKNRIEGRATAIRLAWTSLLALVITFVALGRGVAAINRDGPLFFSRAVPGRWVARTSENELPREGVRGEFTVRQTFDRCLTAECEAYYWVALDEGESLVVDLEGPLSTALQRREIGPWYDPTYAWVSFDETRGAPYRGHYRLTVTKKRNARVTPYLTWRRVSSASRR